MKRIFLISLIVGIIGLALGLPLGITWITSIGAIASIVAGLSGLWLLVFWLIRKTS